MTTTTDPQLEKKFKAPDRSGALLYSGVCAFACLTPVKKPYWRCRRIRPFRVAVFTSPHFGF